MTGPCDVGELGGRMHPSVERHNVQRNNEVILYFFFVWSLSGAMSLLVEGHSALPKKFEGRRVTE